MSPDDRSNPTARERARRLAGEFLARQGGSSWLDEIYRRANADPSVAPWADLAADPLLIDWLAEHLQPPVAAKALVVGCGLGDDAEELADWGFRVTCIDPSRAAIEWCRDRFVGSAVTYTVADPVAPPTPFAGEFDLVVAGRTLEAVDARVRPAAIAALASLLAPLGLLLVIGRGRADTDPVPDLPPWPLAPDELCALCRSGLTCMRFEDFVDKEDPPVRRIRALYART